LGVKPFNGVSQILPRPTLVSMATKFELKLAITRLYVIHLGNFCVEQGVFVVRLFNDVSQILPRPTLVAMATKSELKLAIALLIC